MISLRHWIPLCLGLSLFSSAAAETIEVTPDGDWFALLSGDRLVPGDELVLRGGVYSDPRLLTVRLSGTAGKPIVVRAADGEQVTFERPDARQNTFNLAGNQHLHLKGFEITGGASGIRIAPEGDRQPSDVLIEDVHIHHIGGVAITCNHAGGDYKRMTFRRNHIHHTADHGEAFYLGGNDATAIFSESLIENNYIHDLNGPSVSQGDGIEIKQGSFGNRIIGNVIHDTGYPGVTVYGTQGKSVNFIENNLIWNTGDHGIQAAADAVIRGNFIQNAANCGIYSREHQGAVPNRLRIEKNYVADSQDAAVRIIGAESGKVDGEVILQVLDNQLFARDGQPAFRIENIDVSMARGNLGIGKVLGSETFAASWNQPIAATPTTPPPAMSQLADNPAWQFLNRDEVRTRFNAR